MKYFILLFALALSNTFHAQTYTGQIEDASTNQPIQFVSIGVIGKEVGTVSNSIGKYTIAIDSLYNGDSIRFSSIGYSALTMKVADFKQENNRKLTLHPNEIELSEASITRGKMLPKILGNQYKSKTMQAAFTENNYGYEIGIRLKIKKTTLLEELIFNIAKCTYDSVHYRVNIYKENGKNDFENILHEPIYIIQKMDSAQNQLSVNIASRQIVVEHNTLITIEHIKDMGEGSINFPARFKIAKGEDSYLRKTSEGEWKKIPVKIGFSVKAKVEQ